MTDQKTTDPFEARFAGLVRTYTDEASAQPIDSLAVSRAAMAAGRASAQVDRRPGRPTDRSSRGRPLGGGRGRGRPRRRRRGRALVPALELRHRAGTDAIGLIGTEPTALGDRAGPRGPSSLLAAAAADRAGTRSWATAQLVLTDALLGVGSDPDTASHSAVAAAGPDTLVVTATAETPGCAVGDLGVYRWSLEGKDTFLTLTATGPDACPARETALAGPWVRADLPQPSEGVTQPPGTYTTTGFDPFADVATPGRLSYTVPAGWKVKEDLMGSFVLHYLPDASTAPVPAGDVHLHPGAAPGGRRLRGRGDLRSLRGGSRGRAEGSTTIVAALAARPGVVATTPAAVTIGGYEGTVVDLRVAPGWTRGCVDQGTTVVGVPIIRGPGSELGPSIGLAPGAPVRLILVDVADGRTMAIAIACGPSSGTSSFDEQVAAAMPVIESMELHPPAP